MKFLKNKNMNMNIFIVVLFLIVIVISLYKAFGDKMTHKYEIYHHSQLENQDDLEKKFLKNNLNLKDVTHNVGIVDELGNNVDENIEIVKEIQTLSEEDAFVRCHVPTLNTQQCWQSRYFECPVTNGSYKQCTNNYIPLPLGTNSGNAPCETGRTGFEMAPPKLKLSENCYYQTTKMMSEQNKNMNKNVVV